LAATVDLADSMSSATPAAIPKNNTHRSAFIISFARLA
jgi:hypothetical protein